MLASEDMPTLAFEQADRFDYHFMAHLMGKLQASTDAAVREGRKGKGGGCALGGEGRRQASSTDAAMRGVGMLGFGGWEG